MLEISKSGCGGIFIYIYILEVSWWPFGPQLLVGGPSGQLDSDLRALRALRPRLTHQTCKKCDGRTNRQGVSRSRILRISSVCLHFLRGVMISYCCQLSYNISRSIGIQCSPEHLWYWDLFTLKQFKYFLCSKNYIANFFGSAKQNVDLPTTCSLVSHTWLQMFCCHFLNNLSWS